MNTNVRLLFLCVAFTLGCSRRGESDSAIHSVTVCESASAIVKKEKPKHYDKHGNLLSDLTFRWEMPMGYVPLGMVRVFASWQLPGGSGMTHEVCNLEIIHDVGPAPGLSSRVYECTASVYPGRKVEFEFFVADTGSTGPPDAVHLLDPVTWPAHVVMPKGSTRFGTITISKGDEWSSSCTATVAVKPTDCFVRPGLIAGTLAIDSLP